MIKLPRYTFYATPKKIKVKASKIKPNFAYIVEDWLKDLDPTTTMSEWTTGGRTSCFYFLAPQLDLYVEILDKIKGYYGWSEDNHVCKIDIYSNNEDFVKKMVKRFNDQWDDGIVSHLNLKKLEKKFKVKGEDIVNAWKSWGAT